jgi:2-polyprenyl-3-methyl-5-hydroxy-6-metoxy-1,4-benzoquinol methylase
MQLTKTIEQKDFDDIQEEIHSLRNTEEWCIQNNVYIEVGHHCRYWEYGRAIKALLDTFAGAKDIRVLDIGAGVGILAPTLHFHYKGVTVTECDPDPRVFAQ